MGTKGMMITYRGKKYKYITEVLKLYGITSQRFTQIVCYLKMKEQGLSHDEQVKEVIKHMEILRNMKDMRYKGKKVGSSKDYFKRLGYHKYTKKGFMGYLKKNSEYGELTDELVEGYIKELSKQKQLESKREIKFYVNGKGYKTIKEYADERGIIRDNIDSYFRRRDATGKSLQEKIDEYEEHLKYLKDFKKKGIPGKKLKYNGKVYYSIRDCTDAMGYLYGSYQLWKSRNFAGEKTTDDHLDRYIDHRKPIKYKGVMYKDRQDILKMEGISKESFRKYLEYKKWGVKPISERLIKSYKDYAKLPVTI